MTTDSNTVKFAVGDRVRIPSRGRAGVIISLRTRYGDCAQVKFDGSRGPAARVPFVLLRKENDVQGS